MADVPDLEGINVLEQRKQANQAKLEAARLARQPDQERIDKAFEKLDGLSGQVGEKVGQVKAKLADFHKKYAAPGNNDIFSPEARNELQDIYDTLSPDDIVRLKNNKENLYKQRDAVQSKGLGDTRYVSPEGKVMIKLPDGQVHEMDAADWQTQHNALEKQNPELAARVQPLTNDEIFKHYEYHAPFGMEDFAHLGGQYNVEDANKELTGFFANMGENDQKRFGEGLSKAGITVAGVALPTMEQITQRYGGNSRQVAAAKKLARTFLSAKARSAFMADDLANNFDLRDSGARLESRIDNTGEKMKKATSDVGSTLSFVPGYDYKEGKEKAEALVARGAVVSDTFFGAKADTHSPFEKNRSLVYTGIKAGIQPDANKIVESLAPASGKEFILDDGSFTDVFGTADISYRGSPVNAEAWTYDKDDPKTAIYHKASASVPIATGKALDKNGNPIPSPIAAGNLVTVGSAGTIDAAGKTPIRSVDPQTGEVENYFVDNDGNKIFFQNNTAQIYQQESKTRIRMDDWQTSLNVYGTNLSAEKPAETYFSDRGQPLPIVREFAQAAEATLQSPTLSPNNRAFNEQYVHDAALVEQEGRKLKSDKGPEVLAAIQRLNRATNQIVEMQTRQNQEKSTVGLAAQKKASNTDYLKQTQLPY